MLWAVAASSPAADWPQWRGPFFNGSTDEKSLPADWSTTQNVVWKTDLPGCAASTPVVCQDRVFLSGVDAARDVLQAMCLDRATGRVLWQRDIAQGTRKDYRSNFASSSPVTDGRQVVFFFGNGDLVCLDLEGQRRWARNLEQDYGPFAFLWTFSSSPLWYEDKLYLQVLQRDVPVEGRGLADQENLSYLLAVDPQNGRTLWRHTRPSDAVAESRESFTTPIPYEYQGRKQILIAGGDALTGHDPQTGRELWRWSSWNPEKIPHWRLVTSPVAGEGIALACAPKRDPVYAVRCDKSGVLDDTGLAWVSRDQKDISSDVPTPAFYEGDFFVLSDVRKSLARVEPRTGRVKWVVPTPGRAKYEASPLAADGRLYTINFDGTVAIFAAADGQLIREISMDQPQDGEMVRASIVAAGGQLFIRTTRQLFCIGRPDRT
jgi:outer membrane protein assembly factor BamB